MILSPFFARCGARRHDCHEGSWMQLLRVMNCYLLGTLSLARFNSPLCYNGWKCCIIKALSYI
uniref:Uncharacterized protein n=1 Tax=Oryza brachyantha TaxID=4533 RepID=J3LRH0_ORYBR